MSDLADSRPKHIPADIWDVACEVATSRQCKWCNGLILTDSEDIIPAINQWCTYADAYGNPVYDKSYSADVVRYVMVDYIDQLYGGYCAICFHKFTEEEQV